MSDNHASHHSVNYLVVFGLLCLFTAISWGLDVAEIKGRMVFGVVNGTVLLAFGVMAVAVAKAMCVMMFFMHLKFEGNWKYLLLAPTTILALGIPLALMPDIGVHYYTVTVPQQKIYAESEHHGAAAEHEDSAEGKPAPEH